MNRRLKYYIMGGSQDERNPYGSNGSKGGYVRSTRGRDYGDYEMRRRNDYNDYEDDYARGNNRRDYNDYGDYENDYRQGVRGTGRYGMGGSMYRGRRDYNDYEDYRRDYNDYGEELKLHKKDIEKWEHKLKNADGTTGKHFSDERILNEARKLNINFDKYSEEDLVMTANMLYSDYCDVFKNIIGQEREPLVYTKMAHAFLHDKDANVKGKEKLAMYYYCIVDDEEEDERRY